MKKAIAVINFGTSYKEARKRSLDKIYGDVVNAFEYDQVYEAYTSSIIINKLKKEGIYKYTVEEALDKAYENGERDIYILPTHIIHGAEYEKIIIGCEKFKNKFDSIKIAPAVLENKEDCKKIVPVINSLIHFNNKYEYVLMGHGSEVNANIRYSEMNDAFESAGYDNVHIASVEGSPYIEDIINKMRKPKEVDKVVLHPFMVVAGDHALNDMAGEKDSYVAKLNDLGYNTEVIIKGLGEYAKFRKIYIENLHKITEDK